MNEYEIQRRLKVRGVPWQRRPPSPNQMDYLILNKLPIPKTQAEANTIIFKHRFPEGKKK